MGPPHNASMSEWFHYSLGFFNPLFLRPYFKVQRLFLLLP
jgi:hypothetical protein